MNYQQRQSIKQWAEDDRPREKLLQKGKSALSTTELLAIVIGSGTPGDSAVDLARNILDRVSNDLVALGMLDISDLTAVKGIGKVRAISIMAAMELGRRRSVTPSRERKQITSSKDAFELMKQFFDDEPFEQFWILLLNRANKVIRPCNISHGGVSGTIADPKKIFNAALREMASGIILCHNHPSGNVRPSEADIRLTRKLRNAGELIDLPVLDHLILSRDTYFSFADEGIV
ncbi:MAG: JAB domain-containing protein [Bacteroidia bacterium]|jgi:DNA repair protein RadC|nr:DNA repair protein RadC [Bacteroidales bacterium]NCD40521.1 JAB domain-containing protein [Bacteroidia bacterium]MDD2322012.1 DNA repair protein RadC [Bacteroidales bacterium]MDD3009968.1 DNA repair protein RadC [Bacteroidales bacterium]MDD3960822.1 DNA repair protein RadC [Bacteroidales bacterium]